MHIAIDARIISSSTGRYVERLLHHLEKVDRINTYTILVRPKDRHYWKPTNPNFTIKIADFADYSFGEQLGFKKLLDGLKPDLVHFCMPQQPILYTGLHVTTVHDLTLLKTYNSDKNWLIFHAKQFVGRFVFKHIAKTSHTVIVPSQFTKKEYIAFADILPNKVAVTYEAAEINHGTSSPYKVPFEKFILYVGQQSDYKNVKRLGDAHQELLRKHPDLGLVLVGKMNASALKNKEYFQKSQYKNIHFTGFVPDDQLNWLYEHCEAFIFPSLMEGFGLPGLEAMAHAAPLVCSNATCFPEVYGDAAEYFDPLDIDDMAAAINKVLMSHTLRQNLIKKGAKKVREYSWRRMAEQTYDVYLKALEIKA